MESLHLARLLARLSDGLKVEDVDRYLIRDAQRVIDSIESLVRIHNAQEEDITSMPLLIRRRYSVRGYKCRPTGAKAANPTEFDHPCPLRSEADVESISTNGR